jgi:hypothetical protein
MGQKLHELHLSNIFILKLKEFNLSKIFSYNIKNMLQPTLKRCALPNSIYAQFDQSDKSLFPDSHLLLLPNNI